MGAADPLPAPEATFDLAAPWRLHTMLLLTRAALHGGGTLDDLLARHPLLHTGLDEAAAAGLADCTLDEALRAHEQRLAVDSVSFPLGRLAAALGLEPVALACFVLAALVDSDPALAPLIDELHGHEGRPARATFARLVGAAPAALAIQALQAAGCLLPQGRSWAADAVLWDLANGLPPAPSLWLHQAHDRLPSLAELVLPAPLRQRIDAAGPGARCWALRGGPGSGRHALAGALAHAQGLGLLEALDPARLGSLGAAAALLGAMPLASFEPAPGETLAWAVPTGAPAQVAVRLPRHGGLVVTGRASCRLDIDPPDAAERTRHWQQALGREPDAALAALRLPRGLLHAAARAVRAAGPGGAATLDITVAAVEEHGRHALDGIARRLPPLHPDERLVLPEATEAEFEALLLRCRHRDALATALPAAHALGDGVRALFKGPSGTGKTLAARHLAAALGRPLYRVDLAATVSKYIGETERNLERVFAAAEAMDIVLLLDEGEALLAGRTGVANATDRYANLETNYLLQRLEQYGGVLVITTNAAERIDGAFARRIDVAVDFALPAAATRLELWHALLGPDHALGPDELERLAWACALSGGQIRNAALHATLLALERGGPVLAADVAAGLEREYRKAGQACPSLDEHDAEAA
jgi:hypothetical protein